MALLRLHCFPSTTYISMDLQQQLRVASPTSLHKPRNQFIINNFSLSSQSHAFLVNRKKESHFVVHFSASTQNPAVDSALSVSTQTTNTEQEEEYYKTRVLAQNVPWNCTVEDIRSLFEKHGKVLDVELSMHNKTRNRGLAFVTMGSPEEAAAALNNLESYEFEGRTLKMNYAKVKKKKPAPPVQPKQVRTFNLFVANLSYEARAKDLKEFFNSEGWEVVSAEVIFHDNPRRSSGYGFVSFKTKKQAEEALSTLQGKTFFRRPLRLAPSRQFVKLQTEEALQSDDRSVELNSGSEQ